MGVTHDKVKIAIDRLRAFCPPEGYFVAFSGGKDSQCIYHLCEMAGVPFDAHYSITSVDPPELVKFIKAQYPTVSRDAPHDKDGNRITMWTLIPQNCVPPTRVRRYCCTALKETSGRGRVTVTGVRWAESTRRASKHGLLTANHIVLNDENDIQRRMLEQCYRTQKTLLNPIIDWTTADVWEFLNDVAKVSHCELYDQGFERLGCIGCPMSSHQTDELERWPKYRHAYIRAFELMIQQRKKAEKKNAWTSGEEVMQWWTSNTKSELAGQTEMDFDDAPSGAESDGEHAE